MKMKIAPFLKTGKLLSWKKQFIVGMDLGSSSVKVAQLARRGENWVLIRLALKEISAPGDSLEEAWFAALRELLAGVDRQRTHFVACFNSPESALRVLTVPPMPRGELVEAVRLESKNYFPFPLDASMLEIEPCDEVLEKGLKKQRVIAAVTPCRTSEGIVSLFRKLDIQPLSLIPEAYALLKLVEARRKEEDKSYCLVDIGERHTGLLVLHGKTLIFSRQIPVAGRDFTHALTEALVSDRGKTQLSMEEAETLKREVGLPSEADPAWVSDKVSSTHLMSMLRSPLELLVTEVERCLDYSGEALGSGRVTSLTLFGQGARLKGLPQALSQELGLEVKIGDPCEGLELEAQVVCPESGLAGFAGALGTALSRGKGRINLLPPEVKQEMERALRRAALQSVVAGAILIFSFIYIGMRIQLSNYQKRIAVAGLELSSLQVDLARAREKIIAGNIRSEEPYWEDVLREISNLIPTAAHLTELTFGKGRLALKGVIASKEKEAVLSDFILNLEKGLFKDVKLVTTQETADPAKSEFEVECGFD